jgi:hypothetical protein
MFNISKLLEKLSKKIVSTENIYKDIAHIIHNTTHLTLQDNSFEIKNYILYINTSPVFKNKIYIKKQNILFEINKLYPKSVVDIR